MVRYESNILSLRRRRLLLLYGHKAQNENFAHAHIRTLVQNARFLKVTIYVGILNNFHNFYYSTQYFKL